MAQWVEDRAERVVMWLLVLLDHALVASAIATLLRLKFAASIFSS
jgi:hypothetical protein